LGVQRDRRDALPLLYSLPSPDYSN
jgi:hypothetical protein